MSRPHHDAHGPTRREQQIIDLAEAGFDADHIAGQLEMSRDYVRQRMNALVAPKPTDWQTPAKRGSQRLLKALRQHFPDRCGGAS